MSRDREKKNEGNGADANAWMVTFSDLLMLMLTFFVLLISMSSLDDQKVKEALRPGLHTTPSQMSNADIQQPTQDNYIMNPSMDALEDFFDEPSEENYERATDMLNSFFTKHGVGGSAWCERRPEGLLINIAGEVTFESNETKLTDNSKVLLRELAEMLYRINANSAVEAYYEGGDQFDEQDAAWELALGRADVAALYLTRHGLPAAQLRAMGYGFAADFNRREAQNADLLRLVLFTGPANSIYAPLSTETKDNGQKR